jgi:drug/metabolite transporter (DMT)-like permease
VAINHVTYKPSKIVIGYGSAILAAGLSGSVSTLAKPVLYGKSNRPFVVGVLDSRIRLHPACTTSWVYETNKKILLSPFDNSILGATIAPVMFFLGLEQTSADTSLLANGETVFSILFALVIFNERMKPIGYLAVAIWSIHCNNES